MSRSFQVACAALLFFAAVHLYFLPTPFVSLEFVYGRYAGELLRGGLGDGLNRYLELVANPVTNLYAIVPFHLLLGFSEFATRLPSFLSGAALACIVIALAGRLMGWKTGCLAASLLLLNPMYWTCSGLAYTDVPFCLFSGTGLLLCIAALVRGRPALHWPAALALALSALVKYNGVIFFLVAALFIVIQLRGRALRRLVPYAVLAAAVDLPAYLVIFARYGFLIHPRLQVLHRPRPDMICLYLVSYLLWLGLFMGPFLVLPLWHRVIAARRRARWCIPLIILFSACVVFGLSGWGEGYLARLHGAPEFEMSAGWFEVVAGGRVMSSLLLLILLLAAVSVVDIIAWMREGRSNLLFGIWLLSVLLIGSVSRPANRYLLFVLVPLSVYLASVLASMDERLRVRWPLRAYFVASLAVLAVVCLVTTWFWIGDRGEASAAAVEYVNVRGLSPASLDWRVTSHSLYLADDALLTEDAAGARYLVTGRSPGEPPAGGTVLFRRDVGIPGRPLEIYEVIDRGGDALKNS